MNINSAFLNKNVDKEFEIMQKATENVVSYAQTIRPRFRNNCNLCGTTEEVEQIQFGLNISNTINTVYFCSSCKKWFGKYLLSGKEKAIKEIVNE